MFKHEKLAEYLKKEKISYEKFGESVGITKTMVYYLANGLKQPSAALLKIIAKRIGCPMDDLME